MVTDHLSDFIVKLKNAGQTGKPTMTFPYSKMVAAVAKVLEKEGYLSSVERKNKGETVGGSLEVTLQYGIDHDPKIHGVARISKTSRRVYGKSKRLHPVLNGLGRLILSTPKGIMTERGARREGVGGELLFKIW